MEPTNTTPHTRAPPEYVAYLTDQYRPARPFFSSASPRTTRPSDPQTIEHIIADGYLAVPTGDPITALLTDRGHTSRLGLDDVITQVRQRYEIWQQNVLDLDQSRLEAINALHEWESYFGAPGVELRASVHNSLQRLYQQERDERVSLWKDVSRLRQALPENAQLYLSAHRKLSILDQPAGERP